MLARRFLYLSAASMAFLVAGIALINWALLSLSIPFCILALMAAMKGEPPLDVEVERTVSSGRVIEGDRVEVTVTVRNMGEAVNWLRVEDAGVAGCAHVAGSLAWAGRLPKGGSATLRYTVVPPQLGMYPLGAVRLLSRGAFNLTQSKRVERLPYSFKVMPLVEDSRRSRMVPSKTRQRLGPVVTRRAGHGGEFFGIRDYQPGDDMRRVNWRATARTGRLHVNEGCVEMSGDAVIVLDARAADGITGPDSPTAWCVRGAAAVASMVLRERNRVGLLVQRDVVNWVYPGYGKRQLQLILEGLVGSRQGGDWDFDQVVWVVQRFFPSSSQVILLTPLTDPGVSSGIAALRSRGYDVLVITPSPLGAKGAGLGEGRCEGMTRRLIRLERRADIEWLGRLVPVIDWDPSSSLESRFRKGAGWRH